jgi:large subunit ribosomal protein L13
MNFNQKTSILTKAEAIHSRKWFLFDAAGKTSTFAANVDCGDGVVIINAEKIAVTGMKEARKLYKSYTGFIGGYREVPLGTMRARKPAFILERAIKGMMPKTRLGDQQTKKLRIFVGSEHTMQAQNPTPVNL